MLRELSAIAAPSLCGRAAAGTTDDELAVEKNFSGGHGGMLDSLDHSPNSRGADIVAGLADGGEWNVQNVGVLCIVYAGDFDFAGNLYTQFVEAHHDLAGRAVICTNEPIGLVPNQQVGNGFARFGITDHDNFRPTRVSNSIAIAGHPVIDRSC